MNNTIRLSGLSAALFLLAGCATHNTGVSVSHQAAFNPQHWRAEGRIALRYPFCRPKVSCEERGIVAGTEWMHQPQEEKIVLFDPLGQEHMQIHYLNGNVYVRENNKEKALTPAELTREVGIPVPLASLADWVTTRRDSEHFSADGWKVTLSDWKGGYYDKITLTQNDYYLRLVIKKMFSY